MIGRSELCYGSVDAAILKLKFPLLFNAHVQPVCLPDQNFAPDETEEMAYMRLVENLKKGQFRFETLMAFYW